MAILSQEGTFDNAGDVFIFTMECGVRDCYWCLVGRRQSTENQDFMVFSGLLRIRKNPCITAWSVSTGAKLAI